MPDSLLSAYRLQLLSSVYGNGALSHLPPELTGELTDADRQELIESAGRQIEQTRSLFDSQPFRAIRQFVFGAIGGFTGVHLRRGEVETWVDAVARGAGQVLGLLGIIPGPGLFGRLFTRGVLRNMGFFRSGVFRTLEEVVEREGPLFIRVRSLPVYVADRAVDALRGAVVDTPVMKYLQSRIGDAVQEGIRLSAIYQTLSMQDVLGELVKGNPGEALKKYFGSALLGAVEGMGFRLLSNFAFPTSELRDVVARAISSGVYGAGVSLALGSPWEMAVFDLLLGSSFGALEPPYAKMQAARILEEAMKNRRAPAQLLDEELPEWKAYRTETTDSEDIVSQVREELKAQVEMLVGNPLLMARAINLEVFEEQVARRKAEMAREDPNMPEDELELRAALDVLESMTLERGDVVARRVREEIGLIQKGVEKASEDLAAAGVQLVDQAAVGSELREALLDFDMPASWKGPLTEVASTLRSVMGDREPPPLELEQRLFEIVRGAPTIGELENRIVAYQKELLGEDAFAYVPAERIMARVRQLWHRLRRVVDVPQFAIDSEGNLRPVVAYGKDQLRGDPSFTLKVLDSALREEGRERPVYGIATHFIKRREKGGVEVSDLLSGDSEFTLNLTSRLRHLWEKSGVVPLMGVKTKGRLYVTEPFRQHQFYSPGQGFVRREVGIESGDELLAAALDKIGSLYNYTRDRTAGLGPEKARRLLEVADREMEAFMKLALEAVGDRAVKKLGGEELITYFERQAPRLLRENPDFAAWLRAWLTQIRFLEHINSGIPWEVQLTEQALGYAKFLLKGPDINKRAQLLDDQNLRIFDTRGDEALEQDIKMHLRRFLVDPEVAGVDLESPGDVYLKVAFVRDLSDSEDLSLEPERRRGDLTPITFYNRDREGQVREYAARHHVDGGWVVHPDLFDALAAYAGLDARGAIKASTVHTDPQGLLLGKYALFRATEEERVAMEQAGVAIIGYESGVKVRGRRKLARHYVDEKGAWHIEKDGIYELPLSAFRFNLSSSEHFEHQIGSQTLPRQLVTALRNEEVADDIFEVIQASAQGSPDVDARIDELMRQIQQSIMPDRIDIDWSRASIDRVVRVAYDESVPQELRLHLVKWLLARRAELVDVDEYVDPREIDDLLSLPDQPSVNLILTALEDGSWSRLLDALPQSASTIGTLVKRYVEKRLTRPTVEESVVLIFRPQTQVLRWNYDHRRKEFRGGRLQQGYIVIGRELAERMRIWVKNRHMSLWDAYALYRNTTSPQVRKELEEALTFHLARVPIDAPSGVRTVRIADIREDLTGTQVIVANEDMVHLGGADLDIDKGYLIQNLDYLIERKYRGRRDTPVPARIRGWFDRYRDYLFEQVDYGGRKVPVFAEAKELVGKLVRDLEPHQNTAASAGDVTLLARIGRNAYEGNRTIGAWAVADRRFAAAWRLVTGSDPPAPDVDPNKTYPLRPLLRGVQLDPEMRRLLEEAAEKGALRIKAEAWRRFEKLRQAGLNLSADAGDYAGIDFDYNKSMALMRQAIFEGIYTTDPKYRDLVKRIRDAAFDSGNRERNAENREIRKAIFPVDAFATLDNQLRARDFSKNIITLGDAVSRVSRVEGTLGEELQQVVRGNAWYRALNFAYQQFRAVSPARTYRDVYQLGRALLQDNRDLFDDEERTRLWKDLREARRQKRIPAVVEMVAQRLGMGADRYIQQQLAPELGPYWSAISGLPRLLIGEGHASEPFLRAIGRYTMPGMRREEAVRFSEDLAFADTYPEERRLYRWQFQQDAADVVSLVWLGKKFRELRQRGLNEDRMREIALEVMAFKERWGDALRLRHLPERAERERLELPVQELDVETRAEAERRVAEQADLRLWIGSTENEPVSSGVYVIRPDMNAEELSRLADTIAEFGPRSIYIGGMRLPEKDAETLRRAVFRVLDGLFARLRARDLDAEVLVHGGGSVAAEVPGAAMRWGYEPQVFLLKGGRVEWNGRYLEGEEEIATHFRGPLAQAMRPADLVGAETPGRIRADFQRYLRSLPTEEERIWAQAYALSSMRAQVEWKDHLARFDDWYERQGRWLYPNRDEALKAWKGKWHETFQDTFGYSMLLGDREVLRDYVRTVKQVDEAMRERIEMIQRIAETLGRDGVRSVIAMEHLVALLERPQEFLRKIEEDGAASAMTVVRTLADAAPSQLAEEIGALLEQGGMQAVRRRAETLRTLLSAEDRKIIERFRVIGRNNPAVAQVWPALFRDFAYQHTGQLLDITTAPRELVRRFARMFEPLDGRKPTQADAFLFPDVVAERMMRAGHIDLEAGRYSVNHVLTADGWKLLPSLPMTSRMGSLYRLASELQTEAASEIATLQQDVQRELERFASLRLDGKPVPLSEIFDVAVAIHELNWANEAGADAKQRWLAAWHDLGIKDRYEKYRYKKFVISEQGQDREVLGTDLFGEIAFKPGIGSYMARRGMLQQAIRRTIDRFGERVFVAPDLKNLDPILRHYIYSGQRLDNWLFSRDIFEHAVKNPEIFQALRRAPLEAQLRLAQTYMLMQDGAITVPEVGGRKLWQYAFAKDADPKQVEAIKQELKERFGEVEYRASSLADEEAPLWLPSYLIRNGLRVVTIGRINPDGYWPHLHSRTTKEALELLEQVQRAHAAGKISTDEFQQIQRAVVEHYLQQDDLGAAEMVLRNFDEVKFSWKPYFALARMPLGPIDYDRTDQALMNYIASLVRGQTNTLLATLGHYMIHRMPLEGLPEEVARSWRTWMEVYLRSTLGLPTFFGEKHWEVYSGPYRYFTDEWIVEKLYNIDRKFNFGLTKVPTWDEKQKKVVWRQATWNERNIIARRLARLAQLEGKYQLATLLFSSRALVNNLVGGSLSTIVETGFTYWRKALSLREIRKLAPERFRSWEDVARWAAEHGVFESYLLEEAALEPGFAGEAARRFLRDVVSLVRKNPLAPDQDMLALARRHGLGRRFLETSAVFMRYSERKLRLHAFLAHYLRARDVMAGSGGLAHIDDPDLIRIAQRGVSASQFLYNTAERPLFAQSVMGRLWMRFRLWTLNSVRQRLRYIREAMLSSWGPGPVPYLLRTEGAERLERAMMADLLVFALAFALPYSFVESTLPSLWGYLKDYAEAIFGDDEERRRAFFGLLPWPANMIQPLLPPAARFVELPIAMALNGDVAYYLNYHLWTLFPGGLIARSIYRTISNPEYAAEAIAGLPLHTLDRFLTEDPSGFRGLPDEHSGADNRREPAYQ